MKLISYSNRMTLEKLKMPFLLPLGFQHTLENISKSTKTKTTIWGHSRPRTKRLFRMLYTDMVSVCSESEPIIVRPQLLKRTSYEVHGRIDTSIIFTDTRISTASFHVNFFQLKIYWHWYRWMLRFIWLLVLFVPVEF